MKHANFTLVKSLFIVVAFTLLQATVVYSQTKVDLTVYKPESELVKLRITSGNPDMPVSIRIKNAEGTTIYASKTTSQQYNKLLSLSNLDRGVYFIDLEQAKGVSRKVLIKDENGISVQEGDYFFHNTIKLEDESKKLLVRFNSNLKEKVTIRIMDKRGNIIHEESDITAATYASRFNLSYLTRGSYKVIMSSKAFSSISNILL